MNTIKAIIITFILIISYSDNIYAQLDTEQQTIDSLHKVIKFAKHDTIRIKALFELGEQLIFSNPDTTLIIEQQAISIADKNLSGLTELKDDFLKLKANALNNIGYIYNNKGDIPKAIEYFKKSIKIYKEIGDNNGTAISFNNIGMIYYNQGDIYNALEYNNKSLKIREKINNKQGVAHSFNNIGMIYHTQGDIPKALEYYNKSLIILEEIDDKQGIANSLNNIGYIYDNQGDIPKAIEYYNKSLKIQEEINDKDGMANSLNNIGSIYDNQAYEAKSRQDIAEGESLITKALEYYKKGLKIQEEIEYKQGMALSLNNIGNIYFDKNDIFNAKIYAEKSYKLSKEMGYPNNIERAVRLLKRINAKQGNYKKAYEYYKEEILMHDSIQNEENYKATQKQQARYEYEKKSATDSISNAKAMEVKNIELSRSEEVKKKQRIIIYSFIIGFLIILIFSIIIYRLFIQKKMANAILSQQKEEISAQRDEIETQRDLVTEQKEHIELIHKEVTDSINYAERIQRSFLATKELLDENLNSSLRGVARNEAKQSTPTLSSLRGTKQSHLNNEDETNYFVFFKPKDVVSGDFYWAGKLQNGNFALATADSTGHGVPGAIMSILNISSLEKAIEQGICEPSEILNHTRKTIIERLKKDGSPEGGKDGMDASLICFDFETQKLTYSASNNPIWIIRLVTQSSGLLIEPEVHVTGEDASANQKLQTPARFAAGGSNLKLLELSPDKMPIGKHDKDQISFTQHDFQLQKGDVIYTLTDGYEDQFGGPKGKKFMTKKLKQLLIANCQLPMNEQNLILEKTLVEWIGDGEQIDDITIIGIKI